MHDFENQRVQNLYDHLINDYTEASYMYSRDSVLKRFEDVVNDLFEKDWLYFEESIDLWASEILERLARLIVECNSKKLSTRFSNKIYCLAVINCWDEETFELCDNLIIILAPNIDVDIDILKRVIDRLEQLMNNYTVVAKRQGEAYIKKIIEELKEKLQLILATKKPME